VCTGAVRIATGFFPMRDLLRTDLKMNLSRSIENSLTFGAVAAMTLLLFAGCKGFTQPEERAARKQLSTVAKDYRPEGKRPALPVLITNAPFSDFLTYAMLNRPEVEANFYEWSASVERITVERSLPDPKLTFEAYIAGTITSIMPGLMADFPGPGKLSARGRVAAAESEAKYFAFESSVLQTAFDVKKSYFQLHFLDERIHVNAQTLQLLTGLEQIARTQNETGKGTLQDVLRTQIEMEKLRADVENLEDSRRALMAQFKAALGMSVKDPEPPLPRDYASEPVDLSEEELFAKAAERNFDLKGLEAEVRQAEASLQVARKERVPDFSAGGEVDVKTAPVTWNPQFSMTLPIWRDKIGAEIAEAQANKRSAEARLTAAQISLAVNFAEKVYLYREANRNLNLLQDRLLPRARQSLDVARAAYLSGQLEFLDVIDAQRQLLDLQLGLVGARMQRELSLAELSLIISGSTPGQSPMKQNASDGGTPAPTKTKSRNM
jgi:cobalt-zinc-cadmium efflux system outer membrane protein